MFYQVIVVRKDDKGTFAHFYHGTEKEDVSRQFFGTVRDMNDRYCFEFLEWGEGKTFEQARTDALKKVVEECEKRDIDPTKTIGLRDFLAQESEGEQGG